MWSLSRRPLLASLGVFVAVALLPSAELRAQAAAVAALAAGKPADA